MDFEKQAPFKKTEKYFKPSKTLSLKVEEFIIPVTSCWKYLNFRSCIVIRSNSVKHSRTLNPNKSLTLYSILNNLWILGFRPKIRKKTHIKLKIINSIVSFETKVKIRKHTYCYCLKCFPTAPRDFIVLDTSLYSFCHCLYVSCTCIAHVQVMGQFNEHSDITGM